MIRRADAHRLRASLQAQRRGRRSKRLGSTYRSGRSKQWLKVKNPAALAAWREAEEA
jgi:ATP-dependent DNA ligase